MSNIVLKRLGLLNHLILFGFQQNHTLRVMLYDASTDVRHSLLILFRCKLRLSALRLMKFPSVFTRLLCNNTHTKKNEIFIDIDDNLNILSIEDLNFIIHYMYANLEN